MHSLFAAFRFHSNETVRPDVPMLVMHLPAMFAPMCVYVAENRLGHASPKQICCHIADTCSGILLQRRGGKRKNIIRAGRDTQWTSVSTRT